mmetsp:Transcript_127154/g.406516  ORF Transcript_127154/g.406516 Transcript_127154/m.406516 type:complete len:412 (+) Transcript_127154:118-1353(+)
MTLTYDTKQGLFVTALGCMHTVVPNVLGSFEFWFFLVIHLLVFGVSHWYRRFDADKFKEHEKSFGLDWHSVNVISGITTFFEVFYANQCYARYLLLYKKANDAFTGVHDLCLYLRIFVGGKERGYSRLCARYLLLAIMLHLNQVRGRDSEADLEELSSLGYLKDLELSALRKLSPDHRPGLVLTWFAGVSEKAFHHSGCAHQVLRPFFQKMIHLHNHLKDITDTMKLPVPFQYFHLLCTMVIMNLLLWALSMGLTDSYYSPFIYFCSSFIFVGMMELSSALADPFGEDEVDFPVDDWIRQCAGLVVEVTEMEYPGGYEMMDIIALGEERIDLSVIRNFSFMQEPQHHHDAKPEAPKTMPKPVPFPSYPADRSDSSMSSLSQSETRGLLMHSPRGPLQRGGDQHPDSWRNCA